MNMQISYIENSDTTEIPYSDKRLIEEVKKRVKAVNANEIMLYFCQQNERYGSVFVDIHRRENETVKMNNCESLLLHEIDLTKENFKDNLKEYQREKQLLQKSFPNIKISSNFR